MTQVFFCGLSTSQAQLNDEDLQFYRDTKNKQISEVRQSLDFLSQFSASPKKQKLQADLQTVWKAMTVLSRILGYQSNFIQINKLNLPEGLLIQELLFTHSLFTKRSLRPRQLITHWQNEVDQYVVLLSGVVEREVTRTSILQSQNQNFAKIDQGRYTRNVRKRFTRCEEQIPICLNSKRSELRYSELSSGNLKAVTSAEVFEVQLSFWKRYVQKFKQIEQDYILNFIRKKLAISLNFQQPRPQSNSPAQSGSPAQSNSPAQKQPDELNPSHFYSIQSYDRKAVLQLTTDSIFLLYMGEMLVSSAQYKLEMSKGCVLNASVYHCLGGNSEQTALLATASAKTECIVVRLRLDLLNLYLMGHESDYKSLFTFLVNLESHRRNCTEETIVKQNLSCNTSLLNKFATNNHYHSKKPLASPLSQKNNFSKENLKNLLLNTKNTKFDPNCKNQTLIRKTESQSKFKATRKHIFEWKQIQDRIYKQQKVVQLKQEEQCKKKLKNQTLQPLDGRLTVQDQVRSICDSSIFRNCMSRIQNHSEALAKAVQENRRKKVEELYTHQPSQLIPRPKQTCSKDISVKLIKLKMKQIYMKTAQNQEILPYIHQKSQREPCVYLETLNFGSPNKDLEGSFAAQGLDLASKRGVMKRVKRGHIRRIKAK